MHASLLAESACADGKLLAGEQERVGSSQRSSCTHGQYRQPGATPDVAAPVVWCGSGARGSAVAADTSTTGGEQGGDEDVAAEDGAHSALARPRLVLCFDGERQHLVLTAVGTLREALEQVEAELAA